MFMTELLTGMIALLGVSVAIVTLARHSMARGRRVRGNHHLRDFWAGYRELHERQVLIRQPWKEEVLHWSWDGQDWRLHGHLHPAPERRRSASSSGWCPAVRGPVRER
jgi:hypothetical protein